jgi:hypothetical protein
MRLPQITTTNDHPAYILTRPGHPHTVAVQWSHTRSWLGKVETWERRMDVIELCRLSDIYEIRWTDIGSIIEGRP